MSRRWWAIFSIVAAIAGGCASKGGDQVVQLPERRRGERSGELEVPSTSLPKGIDVATSLAPPTINIPGADVLTDMEGAVVVVFPEALLGFAAGSSELGSDAFHLLEPLARVVIDADSTLQAEVVGHASAEGDLAFNKALSKRRAHEVATALVKLGVADELVTSDGAGSSCPRDSNSSPKGRQANRRVEVRLLVRVDSPTMEAVPLCPERMD